VDEKNNFIREVVELSVVHKPLSSRSKSYLRETLCLTYTVTVVLRGELCVDSMIQ
jgi:hypothetical protein